MHVYVRVCVCVCACVRVCVCVCVNTCCSHMYSDQLLQPTSQKKALLLFLGEDKCPVHAAYCLDIYPVSQLAAHPCLLHCFDLNTVHQI